MAKDFAFRYWFGLHFQLTDQWKTKEIKNEKKRNQKQKPHTQCTEPNQLAETYFDSLIGTVVKNEERQNDTYK